MLRHTCFGQYTFLNIGFSEENMSCLILKDNVFFFSLLPVFPTFGLNLRKKRFLIFFLVDFCVKQAFCNHCGNSIKKLMQKYNTKEIHLRFSTSYFNVVNQIYCAFKKEKIENRKKFVLFSFL